MPTNGPNPPTTYSPGDALELEGTLYEVVSVQRTEGNARISARGSAKRYWRRVGRQWLVLREKPTDPPDYFTH